MLPDEVTIISMWADIVFSQSALTVIGILLASLAGAVGVVFRLLIAAKDAQVADAQEQRDGFKKGYERSLEMLETEAQRKELAAGGIPIPKLAAVKPEHSSPTTEAQRIAAELQTLKAREMAARLVLQEGSTPDIMEMKDQALNHVVEGVMERLDTTKEIDPVIVENAVREELKKRLVVSKPTITTGDTNGSNEGKDVKKPPMPE